MAIFISCVQFWLLQKLKAQFYHLVFPVSLFCSLSFCKFRFVPVVAVEFSIVSRRVSVMDYLFFSMFSENGFLLVSGSVLRFKELVIAEGDAGLVLDVAAQ